ncbi:hypothetical protein PC121_g19369 [Phytophthora cactorum]|nr:hypothetical protein PC121_g19369 [Phytophthora cactorum]
MGDVGLMVASGNNASIIYDNIRANSPHYVQLTDVYKMTAKIKKTGASLSDEDQVAELLVKFTWPLLVTCPRLMKIPMGTQLLSVSYRSTYNYQLCMLMIMDQFGNGRAVQHSVIERNADWHMVKVVEQFPRVNDWDPTKLIMVDKDLNEIAVLRSMFPDTRIILCHFYVLKWLRKAVRDDKKYGTYSSEGLKQMNSCVPNMVYSKFESELQGQADEFKMLVCRGGRIELWENFETNWMRSKEKWVTLYRTNLPHFPNNTNNRLENFFGKLKADLDSSMNMKQCLYSVIRYQRRKEDEYVTRVIMPCTQTISSTARR